MIPRMIAESKSYATERVVDGRPNDQYRLQAFGTPESVEDLGPIKEAAFEPRVFRASLALPASTAAKAVGVLAPLLVGLGLVAAVFALRGSVEPAYGLLIPWTVRAVALVAQAWWRPRYVRVMPGRVEVLTDRSSPAGAIDSDSYDLTTARITIDTFTSQVRIEDGNRSLDIAYGVVWRGRQLASAVLLGAISTYKPGPVPDDRLTG